MLGQIYTYSLIRCLYDKGEDYLDSFWPLVVNVLPLDGEMIALERIQKLISEKYSLEVPEHSLSEIITRAYRKELVERKERKCNLTKKGIGYLTELKSEKEDERRVNELIEATRKHLAANSIDLSIEETQKIIENLLKENLVLLESFLNDEGIITNDPEEPLKDNYSEVLEFFLYIEKNNSRLFNILQDIIFGSIISAVIYGNNISETNRRFAKTTIFLDSNFLFSLLGLRFAEENKPAKELFNLIKKESAFDLMVFDFTVDEMVSVLKKYQKEQNNYPPNLKIGSLYSSLKHQGWTSSTVREFIVEIEEKLWALGITIFPTEIDLNKYQPTNLDQRSILANYKPFQGEREQNHDLAAIEIIKRKRGVVHYKFENCGFFFLTADIKLAKYNFNENNHDPKNTISEVIPDRVLTNLLWLKNPALTKELNLSSIISLNYRHIFIERTVWNTLYKNLITLRAKGKVDDIDITILLYDREIQEVLKDTDTSSVSSIEAGWILERLSEAKDRLDEEKKKELENQKIVLSESYEQKIQEVRFLELKEKSKLKEELTDTEKRLVLMEKRLSLLEKERDDRESLIINSISQWKKDQEKYSEKFTANTMKVIYLFFVLVLVFIGIFLVKPVVENWNVIEPLAWLSSIGFIIISYFIGKKYEPIGLSNKIKGMVFNYIYQYRLQKIKSVENQLIRENDSLVKF